MRVHMQKAAEAEAQAEADEAAEGILANSSDTPSKPGRKRGGGAGGTGGRKKKGQGEGMQSFEDILAQVSRGAVLSYSGRVKATERVLVQCSSQA